MLSGAGRSKEQLPRAKLDRGHGSKASRPEIPRCVWLMQVAGLGERFRVGAAPFTVIGVLEPKGQGAANRSQDDVVFIPLATAKSRVVDAVRGIRRDAMDFILVKASDQSATKKVSAGIKSLLRERHHLRQDAPDDFSVENPADAFSYLLIAVASVSLIVGGISIMNVMLVSVTERVRKIGLRMAVGPQRRDIRRQFLVEAATAGGLLGIMAGCSGQ
jgi:putative ABC transport system permease protein